MPSQIPGYASLGVAALVAAAALASPATPPVFRRAGVTVHVPAGWFISTEPLNGVTDPVQRFVLSSYRVPAGADAGSGYVPPPSAVLAQLTEEVPPLYGTSKPSTWPPRPSRFTLPPLGPKETLDGNRWAELVFRDRKRHFYLFVWIGRRASAARIRELLRALDGLRIAAS